MKFLGRFFYLPVKHGKFRGEFRANFGADFGESFGNFVSNFATLYGNFFSRRAVLTRHEESKMRAPLVALDLVPEDRAQNGR